MITRLNLGDDDSKNKHQLSKIHNTQLKLDKSQFFKQPKKGGKNYLKSKKKRTY